MSDSRIAYQNQVVIRHNNDARYPASGDEGYSPSEKYPEYNFGASARTENLVYAMLREALRDAGLDHARFGTRSWNPLRRYIPTGSKVFVLCNFVTHATWRENQEEFLAKCTHASVVRAVIDYALAAAGPTGRVQFGNSPLQSCDWPAVLQATGAEHIIRFYRQTGAPVDAVDLRSTRSPLRAFGVRQWNLAQDDAPSTVPVVLGENSLLSEHPTCSSARYRVSNYDYRLTRQAHQESLHMYYISEPVLDADVVISVPKLKTHEKVGITCGIKGFVGSVGKKHCLAHHRFGPPSFGGDEYPNGGWMRIAASRLQDAIHSGNTSKPLCALLAAADSAVNRITRRMGLTLAGAWHGNDTCWRMALDLARVVHFADRQGVICNTPQRTHLAVIDGIIGGEGNGPLAPRPVHSGVLIFSDDVLAADLAAAHWMRLDPHRIPTIQRGLTDKATGSRTTIDGSEVVFNGMPVGFDELPERHAYRPPDGWLSHFQAAPASYRR
ncbi:MAG: DUF362 domain-containing protein [Acidobacteria bacterium]|nr:DUF362 domain-containing protein [Acidobacteriota bacterium]